MQAVIRQSESYVNQVFPTGGTPEISFQVGDTGHCINTLAIDFIEYCRQPETKEVFAKANYSISYDHWV